MSIRHVPVHTGSPNFRTESTRIAVTTRVRFAPGSVLAAHSHDRAIFAVMLDGSFDKLGAEGRLECLPGLVWTEPAEERHANFIGSAGANVLVIQPEPSGVDTLQPFADLFSRPGSFRHPGIVADARRLALELVIADPFSALGIDALVVSMLTAASRRRVGERLRSRPPRWLTRVEERLRSHGRGRVQLGELAAEAGVHPCHLAHAFRLHFRMTLGEYLRKLRLTTALEHLAGTDQPISQIAMATGFADQSHLTRACSAVLGITPAGFRRRTRLTGGAPSSPQELNRRLPTPG